VICLADMLATFASVLSVPLPKGNAEDSFDVSRAFTEEKTGTPVRDQVILQSASAVYDLRMGDWKFIERADAPEFESARNKKKTAAAEKKKKAAGRQHDELYNLKDDPAETRNVIGDNAQVAEKMKKMLSEARERGFTRPAAGG
jgi:arylsulfatase A-like enzyme